ncbi:alpha-hydroxy-acid oxidizing enzyme [Deltaproteobacteria bacterium Smac51]|nr:alpha-hydroxy-acid oxidizing enzyme [Deltaproteobacteria bacterium Smac51]
MQEIRKRARELTKGSCRVCSVCDGRVCAGEVPGMGGAGTGAAFMNNVKALAAVRFNTRLIHNVRHPRMETEILGLKLALPLLIGPIGGISFNLGQAMGEADYQREIMAGAAAGSIVAGLPDSAPPEVLETSLACAREHNGLGIPFIKPWGFEELEQKIEMCAQAGCRVIGSDFDSIGLITLRKMNRPAYAKDSEELRRIVEASHRRDMRFIVKGVMGLEDALACLEAGVDGIVVSNHGGRVLDFTPGAAEVLPRIAESVKGRMAIIADGGVRTGVDILKLLALGADCAMIGRPFAIAAIGGGREGVALHIQTYKDQLEQAMIMTGCQDVNQAGKHLLFQ